MPYLWADVRRSSLLSVRQTSSSACEAPLRGMRIGSVDTIGPVGPGYRVKAGWQVPRQPKDDHGP